MDVPLRTWLPAAWIELLDALPASFVLRTVFEELAQVGALSLNPRKRRRSTSRLPAPLAPRTAPGQAVNPPVAEQPRGNRCGYAKHDVADHALPVRECESDGQPVRQGKDVPPVMVRRGSAARTGPPLPAVGCVNACGAAGAFALFSPTDR
jgi:hypothetical protein